MTEITCPFKCTLKNKENICMSSKIEMHPVDVYGGYEPVCNGFFKNRIHPSSEDDSSPMGV